MLTVTADPQGKSGCKYDEVNLTEDHFDFYVDNTSGKSTSVRKFTWKNSNNVSVEVISYGATIVSIRVPDKNNIIDDVVMGYDNMKGYLEALNPYFGATVGRVANRIGNAKINIDGVEYKVSANLRQHQLHGGFKGFDKVIWSHYIDGNKVILSHHSPDGDEGYPGDLLVNLTYELTQDNKFLVDFRATTTKPTTVNLTNHSYFNLAGHDKGAQELYKHTVCINASQITDVDEDFIPTGKLLPVAGTIFDLQTPKVLCDVINEIPEVGGYDHNFCINKGSEQENTFFARVHHPPSGRILEVYSNQPGVQFYTSNHIPEDPKLYQGDKDKLQKIVGKSGANYYKHGSLCLETQNYPDAVNHKTFPKGVLYPGETYHHSVVYKFFTKQN